MFQENMFLLSLWDLEWKGNKLDFWKNFVRTVVKILFWISRTIIWVFLNNFYPRILSEIRARIVETFYAIYLARLLKLQTTSIDKQSEETPSFRKKIVLRIFSRLGEENNLTSDNLVSALLTRLRFSVLDLNFEIFFPTILKFLIMFGIWIWIVSIFSWNF